MERHVPAMRCVHIILCSAWYVAAICENGQPFESGKVTEKTSDFGSALPTRGVQYAYEGVNDVWLCRGDKLFALPSNLTSTSNTMIIKLVDAGIKVLREDSLTPCVDILKEIYLMNVPEFRTFEPGIFRKTTRLQTIYVSNAPKLTSIDDEVFNVRLPRLRVIRILGTALHTLPYLGNLIIGAARLTTLDFENNQIRRIRTAWIKIKSEDLILNYNKITRVESMAFNGSEITKLSLKGNTALTSIHTDAFVGLEDMRFLDLSRTSITALPTNGLGKLEVLRIENTTTLKVIPSIHKLAAITKADLTYPYHCCAFKFPAKHDPEMHRKYKQQLQEMMSKMNADCTTLSPQPDISKMIRKDSTTSRPPIILCGNIAGPKPRNITCFPEPDAFNPCEDIMGYWGLRIAVWFVAILAIVGNLAVLIVLIFSKADMTVPKFLMCNLAMADLCMGIYLTLIAVMDAHTIGEYFNYAIDWQNGLGCQVAGILTVFSTELSIFTLTVITSERWYTITYAIHLNRRLNLKTSARIMIVGWVYASIMAALPLADISGYAKTSICLPLTNRNNNDLMYLLILLVFNGLAFLVIVTCYGCMYSSVRGSREEATPMARSDMTVAKRMALLVFTDFACWAPIAFFAVTALAGQPLIGVTETKILLVFVYPLNSCANPYLYALLTHQYRRDLFTLLARYGICKDRAAKYRGTIGGLPMADRPSNRGMRDKRGTDKHKRQRSSVLTTTLTSSDVSGCNEGTSNNGTALGYNKNDFQGALHKVHTAQKVSAGSEHPSPTAAPCSLEENNSGKCPGGAEPLQTDT